MDSLKLEECEVCYMGMMDPKRDETKEKIENEGVKFKIEGKTKSGEEKFEIKRKSETKEIKFKINGEKFEFEEKIVEKKIENVGERMNERKDEKIVPREKKKEKFEKENQIWDNNQGTGREKFVIEEKLEENFNQETEKENLKENSDQKYGRKKFEEISKKSEKLGRLQRFMKYSKRDVVGIDHEKVINGAMKMVRKYWQKITKHENESNKKN